MPSMCADYVSNIMSLGTC